MARPRINPAIAAETVTNPASAVWTASRQVSAFYVGTAGDLKVTVDGSTEHLFVGLQAGSVIPVSITSIQGDDAASTADDIIILYTDPT